MTLGIIEYPMSQLAKVFSWDPYLRPVRVIMWHFRSPAAGSVSNGGLQIPHPKK